jgi:hypothetical protein
LNQDRLLKPEHQALAVGSVAGRDQPLRWRLVPRHCEPSERRVKPLLRLLQPKTLLCQRLTPRTKEAARSNTLSSRHGLEAFPFHTDFATTTIPPRYILLAAPRPRRTETLLFDAYGLIQQFGLEHLQRCLFLQHGRAPRYCRLLTLPEGRPCFRYNKAVMTPQNAEAHEVANYIEGEAPQVFRVNWLQYRAALIDNWCTLHARSVCQGSDSIGLYRFAVWGNVHDLER